MINKHERDFKGIWIPKEIYLDKKLSWTEKILLFEINSLDSEKGCFASNEYFSSFIGISETQISVCISKLKKLGYIYQENFNGRRRILRSNLNADFKKTLRQTLSKPKSRLKENLNAHNKSNNITNNINNNITNIADVKSADIVIPDLLKDKQRHIQIIGLFAKAKEVAFTSKEQQVSFIRRNLRAAKDLIGYEDDKIIDTMKYLINKTEIDWKLETVGKYIDEIDLLV